MDEREKQSNEYFQKGFELKEEARKSTRFLEKYQLASKHFANAASMRKEIMDDRESTVDAKVQAEVFFNYDLSEKYSCLYSFYYETRQTDEANKNQQLSIEHIKKALTLITQAASKCSQDTHDYLKSFIPTWEYILKSKEAAQYSPDARKYWDEGNLIQALDCYRKMIPIQKQVIELAQRLENNPAYERIAIGNLIGLMANESSTLSRVFLEKSTKSYPRQISKDDAIELIKHNLEAAKFSRIAYEKNPEWEQFREGARAMEQNVINFLKDNPKFWTPMVIAFENDKEVLNFMKKVDIKKYQETEANVFHNDNKARKLLNISSIWIVLFLVIAATVTFITSKGFLWWQLILSFIFIFTLFVTIGAFSLRAIGDLSEENFLTLIKMTLSNHINQLKLLFNGNEDNNK